MHRLSLLAICIKDLTAPAKMRHFLYWHPESTSQYFRAQRPLLLPFLPACQSCWVLRSSGWLRSIDFARQLMLPMLFQPEH